MNMSNLTESLTFTVPLSGEAHIIAKQFCKRQLTLQKAKQVYHNTLAVHAVNFYLGCLGWETNLNQSDSYDPVMQAFTDVADLEVKNHGKLECRALLSEAEFCHVPADVWEDRICYLVVHLNESLTQATILGFAPSVAENKGNLPVSKLRSLTEFPEYITSKKIVNLSQWLQETFEAGWLTVEELNPQLVYGFMPIEIKRGKLINLGIDLVSQDVILLASIKEDEQSELSIKIQVYPNKEQTYLPNELKLIVLDELGEVFEEVTAQETDKFIQYEFLGESGEEFSIKIALGNTIYQEKFVI
ncbi:DUF1822 family protein [Moorena sp. SIO3I6]|uniref:DUF1822 family protein n=1 Tax=Moorena sp. SIO3I6 TaxID=2607831 RepID=UPI0013FB6A89|nr:DUF1822 family protein [Moorena sp. SIO3I6]NEP23858.1 DUF1822 family protein [Moorena sp. SIO3I6]